MYTLFKKYFSRSKSKLPSAHACPTIQISAAYCQKLQTLAGIKGYHHWDTPLMNKLIEEAIDLSLELSSAGAAHHPAPEAEQETIQPPLGYPWCAADDYLVWKSTEPKKNAQK